MPNVNFSFGKKISISGNPPATAKHVPSKVEGRRQGARVSGHGGRDLLQYHNTT
jgi:hypothetical protein